MGERFDLEALGWHRVGDVDMSDTNTEVLVAIGRIEEMLRNMNDKLQKLQDSEDMQWKKLNDHEVEIELLKQRQGPRIPWVTWVAGLTALIALALSVLDRIFVNQ